MFGKNEPEVLVAGAGPVGLFTAACLADQDVSVEIIDEEIRTAAHSYALALHPHSLEMLNELGAIPAEIENSLQVEKVVFYDELERRAVVHLSELPGEFRHLLVLRQSHFEHLLEGLLRKKSARVQWNHRLSRWKSEGDHVLADIDRLGRVSTGYAIAGMEWDVVKKMQRKPQFIVGADGHRSLVRQELDIDYDPVGQTELFGVFEFECEPLVENEVRVVFANGTTNVLWPLPEGRCRWTFQMGEDTGADKDIQFKSRLAVQVGRDYFPHLTPELLRTFIDERAPWFDRRPGKIFWSVLARFERRLAKSVGRDRVWLAGDAIHLTGPVGVQSMNVGLREAKDLAGRITGVLRENAGLDTLAAYEAERRQEWRQLLGLDASFVARDGTDEWVAENRDRILPCLPGSGRDLELLAEQIGLGFKEGVLAER